MNSLIVLPLPFFSNTVFFSAFSILIDHSLIELTLVFVSGMLTSNLMVSSLPSPFGEKYFGPLIAIEVRGFSAEKMMF